MSVITKIIFVRHAQSQYGEDDRIRPLTIVELTFAGDKLLHKRELAYVATREDKSLQISDGELALIVRSYC